VSLSERLAAAKAGEQERPGAVDAPGHQEIVGADAGMPAPCPQCGGRGFLDVIDVRKGVQHEHCVECRTAWRRSV
jgi:hypothetical protein